MKKKHLVLYLFSLWGQSKLAAIHPCRLTYLLGAKTVQFYDLQSQSTKSLFAAGFPSCVCIQKRLTVQTELQ